MDKKTSSLYEILRMMEVNIPLFDLLSSVPKHAKFSKELCTAKRINKAKSMKRVRASEHVSAMFQKHLPQKCGDTGMFTIPCKIEELPKERLVPSIVKAPIVELKPLPSHLKYVFLREEEIVPVIISSKLRCRQEDSLIQVLRKHKESIGWTMADIKGISPTLCMRMILLEEEAKLVRQPHWRLNPPMMEVLKKEVLKLLHVDKKGSTNTVADHLIRIIQEDSLVPQAPIKETFSDEALFALMSTEPWYAHIVNYLVLNKFPSGFIRNQKDKAKSDYKYYVWDDPYLWKFCADQVVRRCVPDTEIMSILRFCHEYACGGHFGAKKTTKKMLESGLFWPTLFRDAQYSLVKACDKCQRVGNISRRGEMPQTPMIYCQIFDVWGIDFMGPF
ncbi:uncharacterized protein LOC141639813 [Silene latifolia]|uniref:uncharacterized protein LOC141639813 n=1 Tax=Silene latifolia TaxID=37657 RepID=UPI003D778CB9